MMVVLPWTRLRSSTCQAPARVAMKLDVVTCEPLIAARLPG
jgi:hypothetical protein